MGDEKKRINENDGTTERTHTHRMRTENIDSEYNQHILCTRFASSTFVVYFIWINARCVGFGWFFGRRCEYTARFMGIFTTKHIILIMLRVYFPNGKSLYMGVWGGGGTVNDFRCGTCKRPSANREHTTLHLLVAVIVVLVLVVVIVVVRYLRTYDYKWKLWPTRIEFIRCWMHCRRPPHYVANESGLTNPHAAWLMFEWSVWY